MKEYGAESIVLGLPKNMNGTEGERAEKSREFGETLKRRTGLPVILWDERLTTVAAEQVLMETACAERTGRPSSTRWLPA